MKNILFIMSDQHRYDCIGAYGNGDIKTPNLDSIAADGVIYTNHYTTYPLCTPARYSLLSGVYAHQHGGVSNQSTLPVGVPTYAKVLRAHGYHTVAVGKMHATPTYLDMGFDEMILAEQAGDGRYDDDYHKYLLQNGVMDFDDIIDQRKEFRSMADQTYWDTFGAKVSNLEDKHHSTTWITNRALEQITNWEEGNNLLLVSYIKPHHPFDPPAPYDTMYDPDKIELLPGYTKEVPPVERGHGRGYFDYNGLSKEKLRRMMAYYYGSITHMDTNIGRIIQQLKDQGLYEDTLILYTADHGEYMGFHHLALKANHMYDPLVKVPLIMKFPKNAHKGEINSLISNNTDIAPTIIRHAGGAVPDIMKGLDLREQERGREMTVCQERGGYMVRSKGYKLIIHKDLETYKFFDLDLDPFELNDVAQAPSYREIIDEHMAYLTQLMLFDTLSPVYFNEGEKTFREDKKTNYEERQKIESCYKSRLPYAKN